MTLSTDKNLDAGFNKPVQDRLLDVAEELFCEHGFERTSVRQLAAAAACNVAAVNYYFGGKDNLYLEVWRRHIKLMREARLESIKNAMSQNQGSPQLEDLLSSFARSFIGPLVDEGKAPRLMKLMAREMIDQHLPENLFVEEMVKPTMAAMGQALLKVCPGLDESKVPLVIFSIAGQLINAVHVKAMSEQTNTAQMPMPDLNETIDHIVNFSAAGIRAYARPATE